MPASHWNMADDREGKALSGATFDKLKKNGQRQEVTSGRATPLTSRGRGTGFAGPQAQRPLGGQRSTQSDKRGGLTGC